MGEDDALPPAGPSGPVMGTLADGEGAAWGPTVSNTAQAGYTSDPDDIWWREWWDASGCPSNLPPTVWPRTAASPTSCMKREHEQYRRQRARYVGGRWLTYGPRREIYVREPGTQPKWVLVWGDGLPHDKNVRGPSRTEKEATGGGLGD